jgi:mono/diheme cytochrome c family protein
MSPIVQQLNDHQIDAASAYFSTSVSEPVAVDVSRTPKAAAENAAKGELKNPFSDFENVAAEGYKKYMAAGCNGCHGGGGGGGMGPPLTNEIWIYGNDDDTLFRVIALGSDWLLEQGYMRKGSESVVGPMPPMGEIVKTEADMWQILAWIRSVNPSSAFEAPETSKPLQ